MPISLHTFEQQIAPNTLKAGLNLYEAGQVEQLETLPGGKLEAQVWDGEMFELELKLANEAVQQGKCSCGATANTPCGHLTAVIFKLVAGHLGITEQPASPAKKGRKTKATPAVKKVKPPKAGPAQHLVEILSQLPTERLVNMVIANAEANPGILLALTAEFADFNEQQAAQLYREQLQSLIKKAKGRRHYLYPEETKLFCKEVAPFLQQLSNQIDNGQYLNAAYMLVAMVEAIGTVFGLLERQVSAFGKLVESWRNLNTKIQAAVMHPAQEEVRQYIFTQALAGIQVGTYRGSNMALFHAQWASDYCKQPNELQAYAAAVRQFADSSSHSSIVAAMEKSLLSVYERLGDVVNARKLQLKVSYNNKERQALIDRFLKEGDLDGAIELVRNGLENVADDNDADEFILRWQSLLLELLQRQGKQADALEQARVFYLEADMVDHEVLLRFMKAQLKRDEWPAFKQQLQQAMEAEFQLQYYGIISLLQFENDVEGILNFLKQMVIKVPESFDYIIHLNWEIFKPHAKQAAEILTKATKSALKRAFSFNYQMILKLAFEKLDTLGNKEAALAFITEMLVKYKSNQVATKMLNKKAIEWMQLKAF